MKNEFSGSRRRFMKRALLFSGLVSGLAALLGKAGPVVAGSRKLVPKPHESGQGYRLTEHVKRYYETARL